MVAALSSLQRPQPIAVPGWLALSSGESEPLNREGSLAAFLDGLPDPATTKLYPAHIGDDVINDAILTCAASFFSLAARDAERIAEIYEGFTPADLHALGLRSAPGEVTRVMAACAVRARFCDQSGHLAPLYNDGDGMKIYAPAHGMIFPVKRGGLTRAWAHYKQPSDRAPRWVSSSHLANGSKVAPSIHVVTPEYATRSGVALLVSHPLEAEEAARSAYASAVALNGVTPSALVAQLFDEWPELRAVTISLDEVSDFLTRALQTAGLKVRHA
jgi:hypothetical protein